MAYSDVVLADSPVAYWRLADLTDEIGSLDLTVEGSVTDQPSLLASDPGANMAKGFDNLPDGLVVADAPALDITDEVSVEAWVSASGLFGGYGPDICAKGEIPCAYRLGITTAHAFEAAVKAGDAGGVDIVATGTTVMVVDTSYHVALAFDGTNLKLYVNGVLEDTETVVSPPDPIVPNDSAFTIGKADQVWVGTIDEVAVYGTALSAGRIAAHYAAGTSGAVPAADDCYVMTAGGLVPTTSHAMTAGGLYPPVA